MCAEVDVITGRLLLREEIEQVWTIDRSEVIDHIYYYDQGTLVLKPEHYNLDGWPPGETEATTPMLIDCFARGGWFYGLFDDERLIGAAILDSQWLGRERNRLQLKFLHVSKSYRKQGLGRRLFALAQAEARERGAQRLYISAAPSKNTVDFYQRLGCVLTREVEPDLFALEPKDIHLECDV